MSHCSMQSSVSLLYVVNFLFSVRYGSSPLFMETPMLHSPLPPSSFEDAGKKTLFLSCRGHDDDPEVRVFVEGIGKFQTQVIDKASAHRL